MSTPKSVKTSKQSSAWIVCDSCSTYILNKDVDNHRADCPSSSADISYPFVTDQRLYGTLDLKRSEDIKGLSQHEKDNMVFLSQSAIQLCNFVIGESVIVTPLSNTLPPVARTVWPTAEKNSGCILFTKSGLEMTYDKTKLNVCVCHVQKITKNAARIYLLALNAPKFLDFTSEVTNRIHRSYNGQLLTLGNKVSIRYYGKLLQFEVKSIEGLDGEALEANFCQLSLDDKSNAEFFKIIDTSNWTIFKNESSLTKGIAKSDDFIKIGGLEKEITEIKELMYVALGKTPVIQGLRVGRSVLLFGSSGTGKTLITQALAKEVRATVISINATDLYTKYSTSPEETIKSLFQEAIESSPSLVILDEIDVLCPSRSSRLTDTEKRIVSSILMALDDIGNLQNCKIFIIATTSKLDSLDTSFRRCGRLDREIEIPVPNPAARFEILERLLKDVPVAVEQNYIKEVAAKTHGFVGADLVSLCSHAALHASKKVAKELRVEDFSFALTRVRPSAMRQVEIEVPNVKWSDIGGQHRLKLILRQSVEWPLKHGESFVRLGITPPRGVLMFGPPGCSKTMIAKALACESGLNFLSIKGPELFSKWVGESERAVREVFRKARQVAPSVIFFDEIDALSGERSSASSTSVQERVLAQLLTELDGVTPLGDVTVLAATNRPDRIDRALLRPGRLDRIVYVPLPDADTRKEIFNVKLKNMPVVDVDVDALVAYTEGYSGAEINAVCHEAAMKVLEEDLQATSIAHKHFLEAIEIITPRTNESLLKIYSDFVNKDKLQ